MAEGDIQLPPGWQVQPGTAAPPNVPPTPAAPATAPQLPADWSPQPGEIKMVGQAPTDQSFWRFPSWQDELRALELGTRASLGGLTYGATDPYMDVLGMPRPKSQGEMVPGAVISGTTGALGTAATGGLMEASPALGAVARGVGGVLAQQPVRQAIVGGAAGGTSGTAAALGAPPWLQQGIAYATALASAAVPGASSGFLTQGDKAQLADLARTKWNIPIYPGQMGSWITRHFFDLTGKMPGSGGEAALETQQNAYNSAVGSTFGALTEGGKLTPDALNTARAAISKNIEGFIKATQHIPLDADLDDELTTAANGLKGQGQQGQPGLDAIKDIRNVAAANGGVIPADWMVRNLGVKSTISQSAADGRLPSQWGDIKDALFDAVERHADPYDLQTYQDARQAWKMMRTVEGPAYRGEGNVSPAALRQAIANNKYLRGNPGDLGELSQIGNTFIRPMPSSQTAERGGALAAGALIADRIAEGDWRGALRVGGSVAATLAGSKGVQMAGQAGAMAPSPQPMGTYWARALINPGLTETQQPWTPPTP